MQAKILDPISRRFREARIACDLTLEELALGSGYAIQTLSGVENGHDRPSKRLTQKLLEVLNLNPLWLATGTGPMFAVFPDQEKYAVRFLTNSLADMERFEGVWIQRGDSFKAELAEMQTAIKIKRAIVEDRAKQLVAVTKPLTRERHYVTTPGVQPLMPTLIQRLRNATAERGRKTELAVWLGVPRQRVNDWLSARMEPSGEIALRLLHWVEQEERKQQQESPASATTPAEPKAQVIKQHENENNSGPPPG